MPSATDTAIPATPAKAPDDEIQRMQRHDEAVNYNRLSAEVEALKQQLKARDEAVAILTAQRDKEQCQRYVSDLQSEGYSRSLKKGTAAIVEMLLKKTPEAREEWVAMVRECETPVPTSGLAIETYSGPVEGDPKKAKPAGKLTPKQIGEVARRHGGNLEAFNKEVDALQNGTAVQN